MMTEDLLVSIVLPTFNGARYLRRAIDACLNQTHRNLELIIVDDASTDETPSIIEGYCALDPRVRSVRHATNAKLPEALNTGHRLARGDYLTWTSDDNWYEPEAIDIMVRFLREHREIGLAYCGYRKLTADGMLLAVCDFPDPDRILDECVVGACFLYRREVYEVTGEYDRRAFLAEDRDYWIRVWQRFRLARIPDVTPYNYTCHDDSLTVTRSPDVAVQGARVAAKYAPSRIRAWRIISDGHFDAHWSCRSYGQTTRALRHLVCAMAHWPFSLKVYRSFVGTSLQGLRGATALETRWRRYSESTEK